MDRPPVVGAAPYLGVAARDAGGNEVPMPYLNGRGRAVLDRFTSSQVTRRTPWLATAAAAVALLTAAGPPPRAGRPEAPPGIVARALPVGAVAPALDVAAANGRRFGLADALANGPVVLVFYRGHW